MYIGLTILGAAVIGLVSYLLLRKDKRKRVAFHKTNEHNERK